MSVTFTFVAISAILFPYRTKELYEVSSVVRRKVAGLPVVTWLGIVALVYIVLGTGYYFYNNTFYTFGCPGGGAAGCDFNYFMIALPIAFLAVVGYYFFMRWYRSKGGMPFDATFKEIPPE
jgi:hypothetical protein